MRKSMEMAVGYGTQRVTDGGHAALESQFQSSSRVCFDDEAHDSSTGCRAETTNNRNHNSRPGTLITALGTCVGFHNKIGFPLVQTQNPTGCRARRAEPTQIWPSVSNDFYCYRAQRCREGRSAVAGERAGELVKKHDDDGNECQCLRIHDHPRIISS